MTQPNDNLIFAPMPSQRTPRSTPDAKTLVAASPSVRELPYEAPAFVRTQPQQMAYGLDRALELEGHALVDAETTVKARPAPMAHGSSPTLDVHGQRTAHLEAETTVKARPVQMARGSAPAVEVNGQGTPAPSAPRAQGSSPTLDVKGPPAEVPATARPQQTRSAGPAPDAKDAKGLGTPPPAVFALIRRVAIQRELGDAAGVLHAELGNMLRARVVLAQVADGGAISSPIPGDLRDAATVINLGLIAETAARKQRYTAERLVLVPLATASRSVLVVWRAPNQAGLGAEEIRVATHVASRLSVLDHFVVAAVEKREQAAADRNSVFRPEALAASRETRKNGELVHLSSRLIRIAIPTVLLVAVLLVTAAAIVQVPTYSRGTVVVKANGRNVISNASGRVATVYASANQQVKAGDPLIALDATTERQNFEQIDQMYRDELSKFLFDTTDELAKAQLAAVLPQRKRALEALAEKTITAPIDGVVSDVLVTDVVQGGEHVATVIPADSAPSVLAFMPGTDRSRYSVGMTLQVEMTGYPGSRLDLVITEVGTEIMGPMKARKYLGEKLADAVALPPSVVLVRAALPSTSFTSRGETYNFFDGMDGLAEIEIGRKSFLSIVIPTGD